MVASVGCEGAAGRRGRSWGLLPPGGRQDPSPLPAASELQSRVCSDAHLCSVVTAGAGLDGVEEIKRHPFFVTIDWNVSCRPGSRLHRKHREVGQGSRQLLGTNPRSV